MPFKLSNTRNGILIVNIGEKDENRLVYAVLELTGKVTDLPKSKTGRMPLLLKNFGYF
jgi:hypothetical protein